jgi:hypothetical protein
LRIHAQLTLEFDLLTKTNQIALIGFLGVLVFSHFSVRPIPPEDDHDDLDETDPKSPSRSKDPSERGSVMTPGGRRSARLMKKDT